MKSEPLALRRHRTNRPKQTFLSLPSMLVLCALLSVFAWVNSIERPFFSGYVSYNTAGLPRGQHVWKFIGRGFPWRHQSEVSEVLTLDRSGMVIHRSVLGSDAQRGRVLLHRLLMNLAVAAGLSLALAYGSERYFFRELHSAPRPRKKRHGLGETA